MAIENKGLKFWQAVCTCCGVQKIAPHPKPAARVNSCIQGVTVWGTRVSSQSQYQGGVDNNGNHTRNAMLVPRGIHGVHTKYGVLPYTHLSLCLSGIASAWMPYKSISVMVPTQLKGNNCIGLGIQLTPLEGV